MLLHFFKSKMVLNARILLFYCVFRSIHSFVCISQDFRKGPLNPPLLSDSGLYMWSSPLK